MIQNFENPTSKKALKWLIVIAFILMAVAIGFLLYGRSSFIEKDVIFALEGPAQAMSGDEVTYRLKYANNTKTDMNNVEVSFFFPSDSVVIRNGQISTDISDTATIEKISSGETGEKEYKLFLVGDKGNIKEIKARIRYNAKGMSPTFKRDISISTAIVGLPVTLTLLAPPSVTPGQDMSYILDYRNQSGGDINDLILEFDYPDGFTPSKFSPEPSGGNNSWTIPGLKQGAAARIQIEGVLTGTEGESKQVKVVLRRKISGQYIDYVRAESETVISSPLLNVSITANGSKDYTAVAGDNLAYLVQYKNNSNQGLVGLNLTVKLDGEMYDMSQMDAKEGFFDAGANSVIWNSSSVPDFADLPPGKSGQVSFRVRLKSSLGSGLGSKTNFVKATATLSTPNVPSGIPGEILSAQTSLTTKISTQPTLTQTIYYNDPAYGSSGALPLTVGKETTLTVHWQITNPGNDMNSVKILATLPPGVSWKNIVSSGANLPAPVFNKNRSEVSWTVGVLPQGTGMLTPKYEATFQITVIPSPTQKGRAAELLKDAYLSGTDSFTKQSIVSRISDANSYNITDNQGQGAVQ